MERSHFIELVPAWKFAGIVPHTVTAPAVIDMEFVQVITTVAHTPFFEYFLNQIDHVSGIVRPVVAAVDQQNIKFFSVIDELSTSV